MHLSRSSVSWTSGHFAPDSVFTPRALRGPRTRPTGSDRPARTRPPSFEEPLISVIARAIEEELDAWNLALPSHHSFVDMTCHVQLEADGERWVGQTESLGTHGAFVATYLRRPVGSPVTLRLAVPTGHALEARGTITAQREVHTSPRRPAGLQIAFASMPPSTTRELAEMVRVMSGELWRLL